MTLYETLDVAPDASPEAIKSAYLKASRAHHPDVQGGNQELFVTAKLAYETLSDPQKRQIYDETGLDPADANNAVELNAIGLTRSCLMDIIAEDVNLVSRITGVIDGKRSAVSAQIMHVRRVVDSLEASRSRIDKRWKGAERLKSVTLSTVENAIEQSKRQASQMEVELKPVTRALQMLADADYEMPAVIYRPLYTFTNI